MNEEQMTFKVVNDEGKEIECEVLFTFESDETKKNYIVNLNKESYCQFELKFDSLLYYFIIHLFK